MMLFPVLLGAAAVVTMVTIIRDVCPDLDAADQSSLRSWVRRGFTARISINRALSHAWNRHVESRPRSYKRLLFAFFFGSAILSVVGLAVWEGIRSR